MPEWIDHARIFLMGMVTCALLIRIPSLRDPRQRPIWFVLLPLTLGSIAIQLFRDDLATRVNEWVGVDAFNQLVVSLVAASDFAAVWWFAIRLHMSEHCTPRWLERAPAISLIITAPTLIGFFAITPSELRFGEQAHGWWVGYAVTWTIYATLTALGTLALLLVAARTITTTSLKVSVLLLAAGTAAELPYLIIRTVRWFSHTPPSMATWGFVFSFARFTLVSLGACAAAAWPLVLNIGYHCQYRRLAPLWTLLTDATPELRVLSPAKPPLRSVLTSHVGWELLHHRKIEIHDSLLALYTRASPDLLARAHAYASSYRGARHREVTALGYLIARVLETTPRADDAPDAATLHLLDLLMTAELFALQRALTGTYPQAAFRNPSTPQI